MGKSSAPPAPDYAAAATAQGAADKEAAMVTGALNRPTEISPNGQKNWTLREGADPDNPKPGDWIVSTSLSPVNQQLYDQDNQTKIALQGLATTGIDSVRGQLGTAFDTSKLTAAPTANLPTDGTAFSADRQKVADALYNQTTQRLGNQYARQEESLRDRLTNQGLDENSQAYKNQMLDFNNQKSDAYTSASYGAELAGGQEQSRAISAILAAIQGQQGQRNSDLTEQAYLRSLPLNEVNALRTGSQVTMPNFGPNGQVGNIRAPDLYGATSDTYKAQSASNAAQKAADDELFNSISSIALAFL
jgi:hypothetical protein